MAKLRSKKPSTRRKRRPFVPEAPAKADPTPTPEPDLVDEFIADVSPAKPELCEEVLRVALRFARPHAPGDPARRWMLFGAMDVYTQVYARGSGFGHTFQTLQRFFRWMAKSERLDIWDAAVLLAEIEHARRAHGLKPQTLRFPTSESVAPVELALLIAHEYAFDGIERFVADMKEAEAERTRTAISTAVSWLAERDGAPLIWANFDADAYAADLIDLGERDDAELMPDEMRLFHAFLLGELARFLSNLGPRRAPPRIAERLERLALGIGLGAAA